MARTKVNRGFDSETARQVISMAVGAAEALVMGLGHVAGRAIAEATRAPRRGTSAEAGRQGAWATHRAAARGALPVYFGGLGCPGAVMPSRSAMRTSSGSVSACIFRMI